jgi:hypothetical protein
MLPARALSHWDQVIDLQYHTDTLGRQTKLRQVHQQWLHDLFVPHVRNAASAHINTS